MTKSKQPEFRNVDLETDGPAWPLKDWAKFIKQLIKEYGPDAVMSADAGYNNVSLFLAVPITKPKKS